MTTNAALPLAAQVALDGLVDRLRAGNVPEPAVVAAAIAAFDTIPPEQIVSASRIIQRKLGLCRRSYDPMSVEELEQTRLLLVRIPALAQVFTLHANGHVREAALRALVDVPRSPFMLAALAIRLNDWAPPVRASAAQCAGTLFAQVDPDIVADMGIGLRGQWYDWVRWSPAQANCMNDLFARPAVQARLTTRFATQHDGPLATTLRYFLREPTLDDTLPMLAHTAQQAGVRATALQVLLWGQARWKTGTRQEWVDKSQGISRAAPILARRTVRTPVSRNDLIATALRDRSALVRRTAIMALTDCWQDFPNLAATLPLLIQDRSPTVRRWADYLLRQQATAKPD